MLIKNGVKKHESGSFWLLLYIYKFSTSVVSIYIYILYLVI